MPYFVINHTLQQKNGQEVYTYCDRLGHRLSSAVTFQPVDGCHSSGTAPEFQNMSQICVFDSFAGCITSKIGSQ